jgi:hypothetical protein
VVGPARQVREGEGAERREGKSNNNNKTNQNQNQSGTAEHIAAARELSMMINRYQ